MFEEAFVETQSYPTIAVATCEDTHHWDCYGTDITHIAVPPWRHGEQTALAIGHCAQERVSRTNIASLSITPSSHPGIIIVIWNIAPCTAFC